jgi:peptidoglycan/xylan/chitin deacetylase (PgdA/CDA1 family)
MRATVQRRLTTILVYHDPKPETLSTHVDYLASVYSIISLRDFLEARAAGGEAALPPRPLVLTFDDGHRGNFDLLPVFETLPALPTIFLCAGIVGTSLPYWFRHVGDPHGLRLLPNHVRLQRLAALGVDETVDVPLREALSREEIEAMRHAVDFQAHGMRHPSLPSLDAADARAEVGSAKHVLERDFGLDIYAYAYPFGDHAQREEALVAELGYACALGSSGGLNSLERDPFRLRRICIGDEDSVDRVAVKATSLWDGGRWLQGAATLGRVSSKSRDAS